MPQITLDNGVIDVTALLLGVVAAILAGLALTFGLKLRRRNAQIAKTNLLAQQALEPLIRELYAKLNTYTDGAHYADWRATYIEHVEKKYSNTDFWMQCLVVRAIPPINIATGELIPA